MNKKLLLCIVLSFGLNIFANDIDFDVQAEAEMRYPDSDAECCSSLKLNDLCVTKLKGYQAIVKQLCANSIKSKNICTDNLGVLGEFSGNSICANSLSSTGLCVTGTARINEVCSLYGASVELAADAPYVLGSPINFNLVIDDPNGDVTILPFFKYTVPVTGYYVASIQADVSNFAGANAILGVPVSNLTLKANNINLRRSYLPFLTFSNFQKSDLSFLLLLKAGDVLTVTYDMLVMDDSAGLIPYIGTATLSGGPSRTIFNIHYIASLCSPAPCSPCTVVPCNSSCIPLPNTCVQVR